MIRLFLIIAAACVAMPALAQLPDYDTARRCTQFAKGNRTVEDQCRRDEADARQEIERSRVSPRSWRSAENGCNASKAMSCSMAAP